MILFNYLQTQLDSRGENMIFRQCSKSDNQADLDTFKLNDLGFLELVHCCNMEKQIKAKEVHRY